jgi:CHAD domain-containing protein
MAYRFDAGQPIPDEVRRVFFEEIDSAIKQLTKRKDKDCDESIHEARKSVKKLRGLLRLVTPLIGKGTYRKENQQLGGIGRKLSELRDARAMIEIFEAVVKEAETQETLDTDLVQSIRGRLEQHKSETEQNIDVEETLNAAVVALQAVRGHVNDYQLTERGFECLERGLKNVYRRGRRAMKQAAKTSTADDLHNWRKRVKDHWYHVRLLGDLDIPFVHTREDELKRLETWLGDDHNLVVLRETIDDRRAEFGHPKQVRQFLAITKRHGGEMREKALALGEHLYGLKPKQLLRELVKAQEIWPAESGDAHMANSHLAASQDGANQQSNESEQQFVPSQNVNGDDLGRIKQPRKKAGSVPSQRSRAKARA